MGYGGAMFTFCAVMLYFRTWSLWLCTLPLQVTLSLRTLAIWERDWRAAVVLAIGAATYNICVLVGDILLTKWYRYIRNPLLEPLLDCYSGITGLSATITKLGFASLMFYDGVMFILILIRTLQEVRKTRARLLVILLRDGMIYYAVLFGIALSPSSKIVI
ncbi:hypothetical protein BD410DRAFT_791684 [Rickenella mellea]|uniref:Uncharacterized protein n=1 Tax=Rickenella mellea TaxID=50990 RepID=A0A4Y7PY21_9AGAM|nr:hypothetical protein BD410DRAFT_791684 [Rickenella mellea]